MIILSGLGNPGKEYNGTRHNIGFDLINCLHRHYNFPEFRKKFDGLFSKSEILGQEVVMFKPDKFMNLSGKPIRAISQFFKVNCKRNRVNKKVKFCKCVYTSCPLLILSLGIGLLNYLFYTLDHPLSDFLSLHSSPSVAFFKFHIFLK